MVASRSDEVLSALGARGPVLATDDLNARMQDPSSGYWMKPEVGSFTRDIETDKRVRVGGAFVRLPRGELETDARARPIVT